MSLSTIGRAIQVYNHPDKYFCVFRINLHIGRGSHERASDQPLGPDLRTCPMVTHHCTVAPLRCSLLSTLLMPGINIIFLSQALLFSTISARLHTLVNTAIVHHWTLQQLLLILLPESLR